MGPAGPGRRRAAGWCQHGRVRGVEAAAPRERRTTPGERDPQDCDLAPDLRQQSPHDLPYKTLADSRTARNLIDQPAASICIVSQPSSPGPRVPAWHQGPSLVRSASLCAPVTGTGRELGSVASTSSAERRWTVTNETKNETINGPTAPSDHPGKPRRPSPAVESFVSVTFERSAVFRAERGVPVLELVGGFGEWAGVDRALADRAQVGSAF